MLDTTKKEILNFLVLTSFLIIFFSTQSFAKEDYLMNQKKDIFCNSSNFVLENKYPKKISIRTEKLNKWYKNISEITKQKRRNKYAKIDSKLKDFFNSIVEIEFENNLRCRFNGQVRLHGGRYDHFENENFFSLRLKINDGHILNNNIFTLYPPKARAGDNEIFITQLFKEIGILSPDTRYVDLEVNGFKSNKYIFQERHSIPFLIKNDLIPSAIVSANRKYNFEKLQAKKYFTARIDGGSKNLEYVKTYGIDHPNRDKIFFESLSKLNFILHDTYMKYNFNDEHYYTDFSNKNLKKLVDIKKIGIFDSLLVSVGGSSGLEADDRRFYYDPIYDNLSPIYYDSMPSILENFDLIGEYGENSLNNLKSFNYLKDGAENSIKLLKELDLKDLQKKMKKNGLDISQSQLSTIIIKIIHNLKTLKDFDIKHISPLAQDYPPKLNKPIKVVFSNNQLDDFKSCDFLKKNCKKINLKKKEINLLLNSQTIKKNGIDYLYYGSNFFEKKFFPNKFGLKKLKNIKLNDFSIFHDISDDDISIDKKNKKIKIINIAKKQNLIFKGKINNWSFIIKGSKEEVKSDNALFGSCITFIDSSLIDVNFDIKNTKCLDAIKFIRTKGSINRIMISNSDGDGLAADYSQMKIRNIYIKDSNDDCINFKKENM